MSKAKDPKEVQSPESPHKASFTRIYNIHEWGTQAGSGPGSTPEFTAGYREFLGRFMAERKVKTVVDFGCGDWTFSKLINWGGVDYTGFDVVEDVIEANKKKFGRLREGEKGSIIFKATNFLKEEIPSADLAIIKDVLQHLPTHEVVDFLIKLKNSGKVKMILITNCSTPETGGSSGDIPVGGFKYLHPESFPLVLFKPRVLFSFHVKTTSLIEFDPKEN